MCVSLYKISTTTDNDRPPTRRVLLAAACRQEYFVHTPLSQCVYCFDEEKKLRCLFNQLALTLVSYIKLIVIN